MGITATTLVAERAGCIAPTVEHIEGAKFADKCFILGVPAVVAVGYFEDQGEEQDDDCEHC